MQTYLFYDIETTGLNKAFDQILQFAAIRTDLNLNEIERYELNIKLNPDVIPAPRALITHHIGIQESQSGISEIDAIKQIHRWMNEPGTISLGYNTLEFDDEFLRFSFYRNLLTPYTHQYANQCGRMDIYPMTVMYFLFKNHVIHWPEINGHISLKLENLNQANHFVSGRAHHAMVDVEATLALAKCLFKENEMWNYMTGYYNKTTDQARLPNQIGEEALMVYGKFGSAQGFQAPVLYLGDHRHYKNQGLWLRLDSEKLTDTTPETLKENTWVVRKKLGEPGFILPRKERFLGQLNPDILKRAESNKKWLQDKPELFKQIISYHSEFKYPVYPNTDIDARLYLNGFLSQDDESFCRKFHAVQPKEKALLTDNQRNPLLRKLAIRLLGRHYPDVMTPSQAEEFEAYLQQAHSHDESHAIIDFRGEKRLAPTVALAEIAELRQQSNLSDEQIGLLNDLETYIMQRT